MSFRRVLVDYRRRWWRERVRPRLKLFHSCFVYCTSWMVYYSFLENAQRSQSMCKASRSKAIDSINITVWTYRWSVYGTIYLHCSSSGLLSTAKSPMWIMGVRKTFVILNIICMNCLYSWCQVNEIPLTFLWAQFLLRLWNRIGVCKVRTWKGSETIFAALTGRC